MSVRRPNPSMRWTVRTKIPSTSVHSLEKTLVRRPNPSMSWTVHFRSFSPNSSHFEPIKQKNAWMVSPIYTLEIQRLSHYCDEKYPNETFDLGMNHNVRTVRCSDCSMFGLFDVRTVRWSDCSVFGLFGVRTVRCSDSFWFIKVIDNAPCHSLLLSESEKPKNLRILFLRPNTTGRDSRTNILDKMNSSLVLDKRGGPTRRSEVECNY